MSEESRPGGIEKKSPSTRARRGERRLIVIFVLVPVLAALGLAAHGFLFRDPKVLEERRLREPLREGMTAPEFTLPDLSDHDISLSDYRGNKVVLVNLWATWCPPCIWEKPRLEQLYQSMAGEDFEILSVSVDALGKQVVGPYVERVNVTYPSLLDTRGTMRRLYRTEGVPESFIVDKEGRLVKKVTGPLDWSQDDIKSFFITLSRRAPEGQVREEVRGPKLEGDRTQLFEAPPQ
jgi:peroxiredoxin